MHRLGIAACKAGWLLVRGDSTPGPITFQLVDDLAPSFAEAEAGRAVIAIDIPISTSAPAAST